MVFSFFFQTELFIRHPVNGKLYGQFKNCNRRVPKPLIAIPGPWDAKKQKYSYTPQAPAAPTDNDEPSTYDKLGMFVICLSDHRLIFTLS